VHIYIEFNIESSHNTGKDNRKIPDSFHFSILNDT